MTTLRLQPELQHALVCPKCGTGAMRVTAETVACSKPDCGAVYPIIAGCPILIDDDSSIFRVADFVAGAKTTGQVNKGEQAMARQRNPLRRLVRWLTPDISLPVSDFPIAQVFETIAEHYADTPRILVLGAGDRVLQQQTSAQLTYTDVDRGPLTHVVCDAHAIPFAPETFDAVICDSVLEHVVDPNRCVQEIHRVLRSDGFVHAITPFMQQVHMGAYDFTRFTHLGHRRLFRHFQEVRSGVANGPAMALAWSFERFVADFAIRPGLRSLLRTLARILIFPVKYADLLLARRPGAFDDASAFYFFGRKSSQILSDHDLIAGYRGVIR